MFTRLAEQTLRNALQRQAAVALFGPRQIGKTTLARRIAEGLETVFLDLESPRDLAKLADAENYLAAQQGKLVVLDEVQRQPNLFQVLRVLIDKNRQQGSRYGQFLVLGSASIDLLQQSSESLAGRITYLELDGLNVLEVENSPFASQLWLRGGFPESLLAADNRASSTWREDFIRTYLERDVPQLGPRIPANTLRRLWTMLAHLQSTTVNVSQLAKNLSLSSPTINRYIDLLADLLLIRKLPAWHNNSKKRLVKSPKIYLRDSGLMHHLLGINDEDALLSHPVLGASWEGFAIENILSVASSLCNAYFYRSQAGAEIDLLLELPDKKIWAIEIKRSSAPVLSRGFYEACEDIQPEKRFVIYNGDEQYPMKENITAISLKGMMELVITECN
jgi:predicted AAA+ superfamily ATPase